MICTLLQQLQTAANKNLICFSANFHHKVFVQEPKLWKIWLSEVPESQLTCSETKIKWSFSTAKLIFVDIFLVFCLFVCFFLLSFVRKQIPNWMDHLLYQKEWVHLCQVSILISAEEMLIEIGPIKSWVSRIQISQILLREGDKNGLGRQSAYPLVHFLPTNPCIIHHKVAVGVNKSL